ncbi:hypothetical protein C8R41DRAFT_832851, partial [Lentinula lateritia]
MDPDLEDVIEAIRLMESDNKIMPSVKGEWKLPIWAPTREDTDPDIMDHVRKLGIPLGNREEIPLVILHKLGSFQHDPILKKRLDTIFSPNHHTFVYMCRPPFYFVHHPVFLSIRLALGKLNSFSKAFASIGDSILQLGTIKVDKKI